MNSGYSYSGDSRYFLFESSSLTPPTVAQEDSPWGTRTTHSLADFELALFRSTALWAVLLSEFNRYSRSHLCLDAWQRDSTHPVLTPVWFVLNW